MQLVMNGGRLEPTALDLFTALCAILYQKNDRHLQKFLKDLAIVFRWSYEGFVVIDADVNK